MANGANPGLCPSELERLKKLGERIGAARKAKSWTLIQLADRAKLDERTVRTVIDGGHVRPSSLTAICKALEISAEEEEETVDIADDKFGSYNLEHYEHYIGYFYAYRRSFTYPANILRSVYELAWCDDKGKEGLKFREIQQYQSHNSKRKIDFSQRGEVYISNATGMVQLLTSHKGALRLITLTKLRSDDNTMNGIVLTQAQKAFYHQPSTSAICFQKLPDEITEEDVVGNIGPIRPDDELYDIYHEFLLEIEKSIGIFAISNGRAGEEEPRSMPLPSIRIAS